MQTWKHQNANLAQHAFSNIILAINQYVHQLSYKQYGL